MKCEDLENSLNNVKKNDSFGSFIVKNYKGRCVEVYCGDDHDVVRVEQLSTPNRAVFCGKVIGAVKEFLVLNCFGTKPNDIVVSGNIVFINTNMIVSLKPLNPNNPITNIFLKSGSRTQVDLGK